MDTSFQQELRDSGYTGGFDLSSLIEACGDGFDNLSKRSIERTEREMMDWWFATSMCDMDETPNRGDGSTPEEAVAKLYISLYNKGNATKTDTDKESD